MQTDLPKLASPARRALDVMNIDTLEGLLRYREEEIANLHGIWPNALKTLKEAMKANGLSFAEDQ